ncbi:MAG: Type II secretion system protein G precursor [bacterium ADurb.Bin400]|nr:MAG: Type II secretion system protein G precursor [bacterium ADurb.Bin400]
MQLSRKYAFSLIELMIVVVIIGTLAAVVTVNVNRSRENARGTKTRATIVEYAGYAGLHYSAKGYYPNDTGGGAKPPEFNQYASDLFADGWGTVMDWDNWLSGQPGTMGLGRCFSVGTVPGTCNNDIYPGAIGIHSPGSDRVWNSGDDLMYAIRQSYTTSPGF